MATTFAGLTARAHELLVLSQEMAQQKGLREIDTDVLLLAMLEDEHGIATDTLLGISNSIGLHLEGRIIRAQEEISYASLEVPSEPQLSSRALDLLGSAYREAARTNAVTRSPEHILLSILRHDAVLQRWLDRELSSDYIDVYVALREKVLELQLA